jgi:hypothetical protein
VRNDETDTREEESRRRRFVFFIRPVSMVFTFITISIVEIKQAFRNAFAWRRAAL